MNGKPRLVVVSNRLPVTIEVHADGTHLRPSSGGLVSALVPVLRDTVGTWVGWTGTDHSALPAPQHDWSMSQKVSLEPVFLTHDEIRSYYHGFSNQILWPLFHGLPSRCDFHPDYWNGYLRANAKFATTVERISTSDDMIWVHDYHLMLVAEKLRIARPRQQIAYFHHIPFPPLDLFERLPWRMEVLRALMRFNALGFQTDRDRDNFIACTRHLLADARVVRTRNTLHVYAKGQCTEVRTHPISVDYEGLATEAADSAVRAAASSIRASSADAQVVLGLDRLDYTKGIPQRLIAFQTLLQSNPELRGRISMTQIVVPSRQDVTDYDQLKVQIETLVSRINGEYATPGWLPVQYFYRSVARSELLAFYRAANVALITPLKDGMNLVAKEFCAARIDNQGVLVLSEFAGAARELRDGALLVNPHDRDSVVSALLRALRMTESQQRSRMQMMRSQIKLNDVFHWAHSFMTTSLAYHKRDSSEADCAVYDRAYSL